MREDGLREGTEMEKKKLENRMERFKKRRKKGKKGKKRQNSESCI